jgi:hypothetical protein
VKSRRDYLTEMRLPSSNPNTPDVAGDGLLMLGVHKGRSPLFYILEAKEVANEVANKLSKVLDSKHSWYADFKNDTHHYIIFRNKVFYIDRSSKEQYDKATTYELTLGIPDYQLDFSSHIKEWVR